MPAAASPSAAETESPVLIVASEPDPVASAVVERWGTAPATGWSVDGAPVRELGPRHYLLRRSIRHIHDERLDLRLPAGLREQVPTLVFPSIHRSSQNVRAVTVHPLGNLGPSAEVGGRPRTLVPTDPGLMTAVLRDLHARTRERGTIATFEATHHGPELGLPAFFAEIGFGELAAPPSEEVALLAEALRECRREPDSRVAVAVGGGHYAPHFSDLAVKRRWAFGHLLSRHALADTDRETAAAALQLTPRAEGLLFARAGDQEIASLRDLAPRLREQDAPLR